MRRNFTAVAVICALFAILVPTRFAEAKTLKMYIPNAYVKESQQAQGFQAAVDQIKKDTDGRVAIKIYYGGQLCGSYEDAIDECRNGTIDLAATWPTKKYDKRFDLLNLPCFAPLGYKQYGEIMFSKNSIVPDFMNKVMTEVGVTSIGGFPECYTTYSFAKGKRPKDFNGFNKKNRSLRVPGMPPYRDAAAAMGYQTVTMDSSEMWNAMQTGQVDGGAASPLEECWFLGRDIVKHIDYNKFCCPPTWIICNNELWASFSANDQKAIIKNFYDSSMKVLANLEKKEAEYMANFKKIGTEIHCYSDEEIYKLHTELRKKVWPNYYKAIGEEFLRKLDKQVSSMKP
ncbi:MAG: TRAP transporter substrate-binding protein DctP [Synergistes jonesii]|uniref:TRAP transporter substrate-binding protein DctP n=1 Tax=Synergistes jonesii TaxID=2754 RepID=UPI002A74D0D4|nr:TRAP transporter substrate-binding protein DctP [Synergistes jonesii]MDY2985953.1 TRAP transporter substrate-binding protein DctP [Synergistes jonesii]